MVAKHRADLPVASVIYSNIFAIHPCYCGFWCLPFLLLSNMPSKPAVLSCMKFFFLFHSLPHPRSWQFYLLISLRFVPCHPFCPPPSAGAISAAPLLVPTPSSPQCPSPQRHVGPHTAVAAPLQGLQSPALPPTPLLVFNLWTPSSSGAPSGSQPSPHSGFLVRVPVTCCVWWPAHSSALWTPALLTSLVPQSLDSPGTLCSSES